MVHHLGLDGEELRFLGSLPDSAGGDGNKSLPFVGKTPFPFFFFHVTFLTLTLTHPPIPPHLLDNRYSWRDSWLYQPFLRCNGNFKANVHAFV